MDPDQAWAKSITDRILADCHPFQLQAVQDPALRIALLVGRGGAKTTTMRARTTIKMVSIQRARMAYVATSRPEAERLNWEPLKELIDGLGEMDHFEFAEQKMRCVCKRTGATVQFFGADDKREINKLRGQPFNEFQVDEAASHDPTLLETMLVRAVGPRLGERNGCIVLGGTPGHVLHGLFYDVTRPGSEISRPYSERDAPEFADWIGWSFHAWDVPKILETPGAADKYKALSLNWAAALEEKKRQGWGDDNPIWLREYLGRWAADNTTTMYGYVPHGPDGQPFNQWDPLEGEKLEGVAALKAAIAKLPPERTDWLYGYGQDLGTRDPYALNVFAFSPTDPLRRLFHVYGFGERKMYARRIAELLIGTEAVAMAMRGETYDEVAGLFGVTGWPVAIVADLAGLGETLVDELSNVYGIRTKSAEKKGKLGAIEVFNGDLADGRMFILAGSELEKQLLTLQWKPDEYGNPREDRSARNDHADAATYIRTELGIMFAAALGKKEPPKPLDDGRKRNPQSQTKKPESAAWGDGPTRSRRGGEWDGMIDDFVMIDKDGKFGI
jgi:hypothetical protein